MNLVIGNSFIGSLVSYSKSNNINVADFCGSGGLNFSLISYDGELKNVCFASEFFDNTLKKYDHIYIYADHPSPMSIALDLGLDNSFVSESLLIEYSDNKIKKSCAYALFLNLKEYMDTEVSIISANVNYNVKTPSLESVNRVNKVFSALPYKINNSASLLFYVEKEPVGFYKDSLYLDGEISNSDVHPGHDLLHMNIRGGEYMMRNIGFIN